MSLPIRSNTTCDIYRAGNAPPADPDVTAVPCVLLPDWRGATEAGERANVFLAWTHVLLVAGDVDIRDMYLGINANQTQDVVWVPDKDGTSFYVVFVELVQRGTPNEHKRAFLGRLLPPWPTNEL